VAKPAADRATPEARALATRRLERSRALPHQLGPPRRGPWVSRGRAPLLAPSLATGRLERTVPFAGTPDTIRVLGLRIEFDTDRLGSQTTTPDGRFDLRDGSALGILVDPPPHNRSFFLSHLQALSRYWRDISYGNLVVEYDVYPQAESAAYRLGDTGDYGPWTLGQASFDEAERFFKDAVTAADQTDSIPFGDFDVVTLFHAGADFQTDLAGDSPRDFPTFQITIEDSVPVNDGAVAIYGGVVMPETENQDGYFSALNGTMAHEFGHTQGLPDLYDINTFYPAVGVWSNMDSGYLLTTEIQDVRTGARVEVTGALPVSLDPWCKSVLWPDRLELVDPGRSYSTSLRATQLDDRILYVPLGGDEYYLIENRLYDLNGDNTVYLDRDSTTNVLLGPGLSSDDPADTLGNREWDFLLPGQGVLIWHIDDTVIFGRNIPPDFGINSNPERRGVAVVEADGIQDIGDPFSLYFFGGPFDPWFVGNHTRLGPGTSPSTATHDGGNSHLTVEVASPPALEMDLTISSEWRAEGWPVFTEFGRSGSPPTYGSLLHDGRRNVLASSDSLVYAWTSGGLPYYEGNADGRFADLPAAVRGAVLFADSLFRQNAAARHRAAVVATGRDGSVYAVRPDTVTAAASIPLLGWPPILGDSGTPIAATTAPVLNPSGEVLVGGADGRVFAITPSDDATVPPLASEVSDTLRFGGSPVVSEVTGNLAVGRFTGASGYLIAYALRNGRIRLVSPNIKDPNRVDVSWPAGGANFAPYLLGVDVDRAADHNLELVAVDPSQGLIHCFDLQGNELRGWPVAVTAGIPGAAAAGDLDGDGFPEIFVVDDRGYAHRWNRNGIEPIGWPVALAARYGSGGVGTSGSPVVGDLNGDGGPELLVALTNGLLVALGDGGTAVPGWPIAAQPGDGLSPVLLSLSDADTPPNPPGPAWLHAVAVGGDGLWNAFQVDARADSALIAGDGVSRGSPWIGYGGNRRRTSVLEDTYQAPAAPVAAALARGSFYCYPNPARGEDVGVAYTLGAAVTAVVIRVMDPLGNEVLRTTGPTGPAGQVARIPVRQLASGVYLVRIEVTRAGSSEVAFQKFAVVR
jgi:M6 family metalloprotease-like protein